MPTSTPVAARLPERPAPHDAVRSPRRSLTGLDVAMIAFYVLLAVCEAILGALHAGWPSAIALDAAELVALLAFCLVPAWRPIIGRLLILGLTAGILELFTDAAGERVVHSLIYPSGEPMLWTSPIYMPVAWTCVLTELGYFAWRIPQAFPSLPWRTLVALGALFGAITVPFYEEMAYHAGWWRYAVAPRIGHTPLYVLLFEGLVGALLPLAVRDLTRRGFKHALLLGGAVGVWMPCAALCSWLLIGR
ncbi:MAG TPA: hypothetical protein VF120_04035 [Ktedonobacterales bacterium]